MLAKPVLTVAIAELEELHVADNVRFCVVWSEYVPMALNCSVAPSPTDADDGLTAIETRLLADPVPTSVTTCGLLPPLSTKLRVPDLVPVVVGWKVTEAVQLAPAASILGRTGHVELT